MTKDIQTIEPTTIALMTPPEMLTTAITSGAGIEVLERLMTMNERWEANQARKAFEGAVSDLRGNLPGIVKNREGYGYKYEDLADIVAAISPPMANLGLSFRWRTDAKDGLIIVTCIISHRDGHSEETSLPARPDTSGSKNDIQAIGSAVTYLQRYTLKAAVGIAAAHDDDGDKSGKQPQQQTKPAKPKAKSRDDFTTIVEAIRGFTTEQELRDYWTTKPWAGMPKDWISEISDEKNAKIDKLNATKNISATASLDSQFPGDMPFDDGPFPADTQQAMDNFRS